MGMSSRLSISFGTIPLCLPRWLGKGWSKFAKISAHLAKALLKGFAQTWGASNALCWGTTFTSLAAWRGDVDRVFILCMSLGGLGVVLGLAVLVGCPWWDSCFSALLLFTLWCGTHDGFASPHSGCVFLWFLIHSDIDFWPFVFKKIKPVQYILNIYIYIYRLMAALGSKPNHTPLNQM
jgi:hypothetical protein